MKKIAIGAALSVIATFCTYLSVPVHAYDPNAYIGGAYAAVDKPLVEYNTARSYPLWLFPSSDGTPITGTATLTNTTPSQCEISQDGSNWVQAYTVSFNNVSGNANFGFNIRPVNDTLADGSQYCTVTISVNVTGSYYAGFPVKNVYNNLIHDDDGSAYAAMDRTMGWGVSEDVPASYPGLTCDMYMVTMNGPLNVTVTLTATTDGQCQFTNNERTAYIGTAKTYTIAPFGDHFTNSYPFVLGPVEDNVVEGYHSCVVTTRLVSSDTKWSSISFPVYKMFIVDNDSGSTSQSNGRGTAQSGGGTSTTPAQSSPATTSSDPSTDTTGALSEVLLNDRPIASLTSAIYKTGKALALRGKAPPNSTINLYIFSTPRTASVKADSEGKWAYNITGLEPGQHRVEASLTDSTGKITQERTVIARFTIAAQTAPVTTSSTDTKKVGLVIAIILILIALASLYLWPRRHIFLRRIKRRK